MASYSNSRDYSKATEKRAEWSSWGNRPDTDKEIAAKTAALEINLAHIAARRNGTSRDDALDLYPEADVAYDMGSDDDDAGMLDLIEKQCRDRFSIRK